MAEENITYLEAKKKDFNSYANIVSTNNRFEALSKESNKDFPHLPTRHSPATRPANLFLSQPARSTITTRPIRNNSSQQENTTKKRKASSPINVTQIPPMFPFSFGPSQPLPPNEPCVPESPEDKFLNVLFSTLQHILSEVKTFEELANIDITYVKNIYKSSHPLDEQFNDQDEY
nr:unnamed protein product [Callosobruchus analis]CAI5828596.1 unnamed protein product [Callosobruchus analis]